jgi:hypothetical protein
MNCRGWKRPAGFLDIFLEKKLRRQLKRKNRKRYLKRRQEMTTLNELNETFDRIEKTVDHLLEFVEDVEKMREIQKLNSCVEPEAIKEMEAAEAKVDAFLAKRKEK